MPDSAAPRRYFHSLDALRFLAFLKVFFFHLPVEGTFPVFAFLKQGGGTGVLFFFVLSAFLITWLLVTERLTTGTVRVGAFYARRARRIWPLYYVVVALAYGLPLLAGQAGFALPNGPGYVPHVGWSVLFAENYRMLLTDALPRSALLITIWSLCVEEQFYLLWPWLVRLVAPQRLPLILGSLVGLGIGARWLEVVLAPHHAMRAVDLATNLDVFALGGLLGWAVAVHQPLLNHWAHQVPVGLRRAWPVLLLAVVLAEPVLFPSIGWGRLLQPTVLAALTASMLALVVSSATPFRIAETSWLTALGRLSYGLYLLHVLVLRVGFHVVHRLGGRLDSGVAVGLFAGGCLALTIGLSQLSWQWLERPVLRWRTRHPDLKVAGQRLDH